MDDVKLERLLDTIAAGVARGEQPGIETRNEVRTLRGDVDGLKVDVASMKSDMVGVKADIASLKSDVSVLKADVSVLKADVTVLKVDVSVLKTDVAVLKTDVAGLKLQVGDLHQGLTRADLNIAGLRTDVGSLKIEFHEFKDTMISSVDRLLQAQADFAAEKVAIDATLRRHDSEIGQLRAADATMQQEIGNLRSPS